MRMARPSKPKPGTRSKGSNHFKGRCSGCLPWFLFAAMVFGRASAKSSSNMPGLGPGPAFQEAGMVLKDHIQQAHKLAKMEQEVEDYNAVLIASATKTVERLGHRRLIALPLDERFDPPITTFSHGHLQTGDKVSVPKCFARAIAAANIEVPYLLRIKRVEGVTSEPRVDVPEEYAYQALDEVVGSLLDARSPPNYIFLPWWMMRALGLRPRDVVDVSLIEETGSVPPGSYAKLRPHSKEWSKQIANAASVLEMELRHYSSLTKGSTIGFDYNDRRYWFDVLELKSAPKMVQEKVVRAMDCNVATDFTKAKDDRKS